MKAAERWSEHTKPLPPLAVSNYVRIQNQTGPHPTKLDKTGIVIEVRQFDQYVVRVDGSGRVTIRNRKFLRKYLPVHLQPPWHAFKDDLRLANNLHKSGRSPSPQPPGPPPITPATEPSEPKPNSSLPTPVLSNGNPSIIEAPTPTEALQPLVHPMANSPPHHAIGRATTTAQEPTREKLPLAMWRLMDHNKKGLLEQ